ncbi:hypothetical protein K458DRAFT_385716 [Lentithecium fluviatile CBS 122367]|uniref:C2H2-type domain-containing protein n=1 Tax=Lentithecium fluviatile CBS 122367 TaxID=1168545 RepID=A0A6G1JDA1_9PLEO|nr:hypothetical protein K458DRAFT_385716 [Lentithecium fluviatile CBS 122367]
MAPKPANRFALFAEPDDAPSPKTEQDPNPDNLFANQVADDDSPWQEVKRGSSRLPGQGQVRKPRILNIREESKQPFVRIRPKQRDVSGSTQASSIHFDDLHENWCGVCSHKFSGKQALLNHLKQAPGDHSNYCNLCKRVFKDRNGLKNHVDNSLGHEIFCNLCLSAFKDDWGLKNHLENNYSVGHQFVCLTCLLGFRTKIELTKHLHTGKKHVVCNTCHRTFRNQDERDAHWKSTTKHRHCLQSGCDFNAPTAKILEKHLKEDHFQCEGCKQIFPSQNKLTLHHGTCKFEVRCRSCGTRCVGQMGLATHLGTCVGRHNDSVHTPTNDSGQTHATTIVDKPNASTQFMCFACSKPMPSHTASITHIERGECHRLPERELLVVCLGKWWYSPLYMDLDLHAHIRRNEVNIHETWSWMEQGFLHPFLCRSEGCKETFARFSELVAHFESGKCDWGVERLGSDLLRKELVAMVERRDSLFG